MIANNLPLHFNRLATNTVSQQNDPTTGNGRYATSSWTRVRVRVRIPVGLRVGLRAGRVKFN